MGKRNDWIVYVCVCVCGSWTMILWMCVCVCVYEKCLVVISLQRICRIPCRKEESVSFRFLTGNRKKNCVFKSSVQLLGAPWQESNPGMIVKKTLPALGADIWLMFSKMKKEQFLWDVNRMVEQLKLCCLTMAKLLLYGRWPNRLILKGGFDAPPFEFGFYCDWRARRTLIPCEGPIVTFNRLWLFHLF